MKEKMNTWALLWVCSCMWPTVVLERVLVDMSGQACYDSQERMINNDQVYSVYADYRPNQQPTLDHCDVGIRATESGRRLEYLVDKLTIFDCGISIWIYDNPQLVSQPTRVIKCSDDTSLPLRGKTSHGVIKISLRKESTQAVAFEFQIHVKTDYGPPFDFERDSSTFYEDPLDTGTIVGIVIAGSVLIIAVAGLAIYCCLRARMNNRHKHAEASDAPSAPTVYTTGTSRVLYQPTASSRHSSQNGGGFHRPSSQDSYEKVYPDHKAHLATNDVYAPSKGVDGHAPYKDSVHGYKNDGLYDGEKFDRQASLRGSQKRRPHDDTDHTHVKGGHVSRRDSGRGSRVRYDKKTHYSRHEDYGSVGRSKKQAVNGHRRTRSRSPNASQGSIGSTVDSNTLVYGYNRSSAAHPDTAWDQHPRSRSGSRSRSRSRPGSQRSGSVSRSRTGSLGRSDARGRSEVRDNQRPAPKNARQYGDMSDFLPEQPQRHRSRSRSASVGRRPHRR